MSDNQILYFTIYSVILLYAVLAYFFNITGPYITSAIIFILFVLYFFKKSNSFNVSDNKWRMFALLGTVATGITFLMNGINIFRTSKEIQLQNVDSLNKLASEITKDIEDLLMKHKNELGYLFYDIYGAIGKKKINNYTTLRNKDFEYLAALKIFRSYETIILIAMNIYGVTKLTDPNFQGIASTMQTVFSSKLIKNYWSQTKSLFNDEVVEFIDDFLSTARIEKI